jgi:hypothetical protein
MPEEIERLPLINATSGQLACQGNGGHRAGSRSGFPGNEWTASCPVALSIGALRWSGLKRVTALICAQSGAPMGC